MKFEYAYADYFGLASIAATIWSLFMGYVCYLYPETSFIIVGLISVAITILGWVTFYRTNKNK